VGIKVGFKPSALGVCKVDGLKKGELVPFDPEIMKTYRRVQWNLSSSAIATTHDG